MHQTKLPSMKAIAWWGQVVQAVLMFSERAQNVCGFLVRHKSKLFSWFNLYLTVHRKGPTQIELLIISVARTHYQLTFSSHLFIITGSATPSVKVFLFSRVCRNPMNLLWAPRKKTISVKHPVKWMKLITLQHKTTSMVLQTHWSLFKIL